MTIYTIGHSNRSSEEFISLLEEYGIGTLADVRRFPGSRKFPHFNSETLEGLLAVRGIKYLWCEALGGRRRALPGGHSPNTLIRSAGFRNYADYMMTDEFSDAVQRLLAVASESAIAIMCAEKFYWKCHRRLLSDYLAAHDIEVIHILDHGNMRRHELMDGAVVTRRGKVIYPESPSSVSE